MLKLACADFSFPLLPHEHSLKLIAMLGLQGVDIGLFEGRSHLWPSKEFSHVLASAKQLKENLDALGLKAADIFLQMAPDFEPFAINHPESARREKARGWFLKTLEYANGCGCYHVTILPGVHFAEESYQDSFARAKDELAWRVEQAKAADIVFGVEAHVGSILPEPKSAENLVSSVPDLTLTLDYTHFTRMGISDDEVEPLIAYASHFHARGAKEGRLQVNFDQNVIDYERVYRALQAAHYDGWLGIEYVWIDWEKCNESDNVSETIRFRDFFRSLDRN